MKNMSIKIVEMKVNIRMNKSLDLRFKNKFKMKKCSVKNMKFPNYYQLFFNDSRKE